MNEIKTNLGLDLIFLRRSVRAYTSKKLDRETIESLLRAAVVAPTAMHQEPWRFVIIQDQALLKKISTITKPLFEQHLHLVNQVREYIFHDFSDPNYNIFYGADTLIVIVAKVAGHFVEADCWLAAENIMLAACQMGLGTCVIGSAVMALNTQEIRDQLKIPSGYAAIAPIIVGVPQGITATSLRKEPIVLSWIY